MDKGEQQLVELVNAWAAYRETTADADVAGFCLHYLTEQVRPAAAAQPDPTFAANNPNDEQRAEGPTGKSTRPFMAVRPEARLGALVGRLSRYAYVYSKKAMQPINFRSIEEPIYLMVLMQMETPKKSELIYEMMSEFASGIDIVNRLIGMGYIEEFPDETDRRSKRLRITAQGIAIAHQCLPVMDKAADVTYSSLTDGEKALLVQILDKLDRYHAEHYRQSKNADFDEVYQRMVG